MKNKLILVLAATLLTVSMIGCGSKEKQTADSTENKATVSADEVIDGYYVGSKGYLVQA